MNRPLGISIWGVLSLTIGVLIADYAFAPLRVYPAADTALPTSETEPTARPKQTETPSQPAPRNLPPLRLEQQGPVGEAEGDPMYAADLRPLFEAIWQDRGERAQFRVSSLSAAALAGEPVAGVASVASAGLTGLGGTIFGTQRRERALAAQNGSSFAEAPADEIGGALPSDDMPEMTSMSSEPSIPGAVGGSPPAAMPPSTEPVTGGEEKSSPASLPPAPRDEQPTLVDDVPPSSLPHVTVPEPLPGSLLLVGLILGVFSRRRGRVSLH